MILVADITADAYCSRPMAERGPPTPLTERQIMAAIIRARREALEGKPSPQKLAASVGITSQAWRNYESGASGAVLHLSALRMIARALKTTPEDLLLEHRRRLGPHEREDDLPERSEGPGMAAAKSPAFQQRQAVFPLGDRAAVLSYPEGLTADEAATLGAYLDIFVKGAAARN